MPAAAMTSAAMRAAAAHGAAAPAGKGLRVQAPVVQRRSLVNKAKRTPTTGGWGRMIWRY